MRLPPASPSVVQGPRISHVPPAVSSLGVEAVELAKMAGLDLDPWEAVILSDSLGEREDGRWAAFEVGLCAPRQNGKDAILEARELTGLFLLPDEKTLIHSAHEFATSLEHFQRIENLIEGCSDLSRRVRTVKRSHGEEGFVLKDGTRLRFKARTKAGARGFTADLVVFNEAMILPSASHGAILPTLAARSMAGNPQVWYTGSAVDQSIHDHGVVFARVRQRGIDGDEGLMYVEFSADAEIPDDVTEEMAKDPAIWAGANPGFGIRISSEHVGREQRAMDQRTFAVERLGVGDWPDPDDDGEYVIDRDSWAADADAESAPSGPLCFALDVAPDRSWSSISVAGLTAEDLEHVEVVARRRGTRWVPGRLKDLVDEHDAEVVILDGAGPAASLLPELDGLLDIEIRAVSAKEYAQACGGFYDAAVGDDEIDPTLRHRNQPALNAAVKGAAKRSLSDAWAWSRKSSAVDITPLVSATLAHWGSRTQPASESVYQDRGLIVLDS